MSSPFPSPLQRLPGAAFIEACSSRTPSATRSTLRRLPGAAFIEAYSDGYLAAMFLLQRLPGAAFISARC